MAINRRSFLELPLDTNTKVRDLWSLSKAAPKARLAALIGMDAWLEGKKEPGYRDTLGQIDFIAPRNGAISGLATFLKLYSFNAITFDNPSIAHSFFKEMVNGKRTLMLIGGKPRDDEELFYKLKARYPGINIVETTHGYADFGPKIALALRKNPQVILVSMKSPRQEQFLVALRDAGYTGFALGCGDFIERYAMLNYSFNHKGLSNRLKLSSLYQYFFAPKGLRRRLKAEVRSFIGFVLKQYFPLFG